MNVRVPPQWSYLQSQPYATPTELVLQHRTRCCWEVLPAFHQMFHNEVCRCIEGRYTLAQPQESRRWHDRGVWSRFQRYRELGGVKISMIADASSSFLCGLEVRPEREGQRWDKWDRISRNCPPARCKPDGRLPGRSHAEVTAAPHWNLFGLYMRG